MLRDRICFQSNLLTECFSKKTTHRPSLFQVKWTVSKSDNKIVHLKDSGFLYYVYFHRKMVYNHIDHSDQKTIKVMLNVTSKQI